MKEYREFCNETRCIHYNSIKRLEAIEDPNDAIKRDLGIAEVQCKQNCQRTTYDFYNWLKEQKDIPKEDIHGADRPF